MSLLFHLKIFQTFNDKNEAQRFYIIQSNRDFHLKSDDKEKKKKHNPQQINSKKMKKLDCLLDLSGKGNFIPIF